MRWCGFPLQLTHLHLHGRAEQASKSTWSILENLTFLFHEMAEEGMGPASGVAPVTRVVEVVKEITLNRPASGSPEEDEAQADDAEDDLSFDYVVKEADEELEEGQVADEEGGAKFEYEVKQTNEEVVEEEEEIFTYVVKDVDQDQHPEEGKLVVDAKQVLMCQYCKTELTDESEDARACHRDQCAKYQEYKATAKKDAADPDDKSNDDADEVAGTSDEEEADAGAEEGAEGNGREEGNEDPVDEDGVPTETNHASSSPIPGDETQQDGEQHEEDAAYGADDDAQETTQSSPISSVTSPGHEQQDAQKGGQQDGPRGEDPKERKPDYSTRLRSRKTQQSTSDGDTSASSLLVDQDLHHAWNDHHYRYFVDDVGKPKAECLKCGKVYCSTHTKHLQDHLSACDKPKDASQDPDDFTTDDEIPVRRPKPSITPAAISPSDPAASKRPRQTPRKQNGEKPKNTATPTKLSTPALGKRKKAALPSNPRRPPAAKRLKLERKPAATGSVVSSASKSVSQSAKSSTAGVKPQLTASPQAAQAKPDAAIKDYVMQFEPIDGTRKVRCKHCGSLVALQRKMPSLALERHLKDCNEYTHRQQQGLDLAAQLAATSSDQDEAMELLGQAILDKRPAACVTNTNEQDPYSTLVWLAGSVGNASTLKSHYGRSAVVVHGPSRRFEQFVDQQLHSLDIPTLLAQVATPVTVFVRPAGDNGNGYAMEVDSQATALYRQGFSMIFDAPSSVCELLAPPFAIDRGLGAQRCEASVVCGRASPLDWQYHRMDAICIQLRGETSWRVKKGVVRHPLRCAHPMELPMNLHDASHAADLLTQMHQDALDPEEDDLTPPQDDAANSVHEAMTEAGSVVYLPAGTWFTTESASDAVWLEMRMGSANYAQWLLDSVKHMLWRSPKWRTSAITEMDLKAVRSHVGDLIQDMQHLVASLTPADLLPEYLGMAAAHSDAGQPHEWDLTHQHFTGSRHVRLLQSSHFRVNPLARLTSLDEVQPNGPPLPTPVSTQPAKTGVLSKHRRNLKALAPVPARVYVLYLLGGEALFDSSKLRVQFSCNAFQVALVEWIRGHSHRGGSLLFTSSDVAAALQERVGKAVSPDDDAVKYMLRFLCFAGYLTLVKAT